MGNDRRTIRVRVDAHTRFCLTAITILLAVTILGLWAEAVHMAPQALAGEPFVDASRQREAMIKAQEKTNEKLDQLIGLLREGQARVRLVKEDDGAGGGGNGRSTGSK